jgi:ribosomal protein S18 acetylase RimI-like enzyme
MSIATGSKMPNDKALSLRTATPADAPLVRDLVRAAYARWVPIIGREPKPMRADYAAALRDHRIDLFYYEIRPIALIETILRSDHLFIENIAILPEYQGHGLGRRLLAHAERLAAEAGLGELRLLTNGKMAKNIALYRTVGYAIDREEPFMDGTVVYMSKTMETRSVGPL